MSRYPLGPHSRAREIFDEACEREPAERAAYLDQACEGDSSLRLEVESLLSALTQAGDFLEQPAVTDLNAPSANRIRIDGYRVRQLLATGGMGAVYLADQQSPARQVALKILRWNWAGTDGLRRFEWEAQALGRLRHPGIAQIYESGVTSTDMGPVPFLSMELVEGLPITEHVTQNQQELRERVQLLCMVCDAIHHAHGKRVLHRDLKPANILVDANGQPKILDFGVARTLEQDSQETRHTQDGQVIGTLAYMSPEQVQGAQDRLDVMSDVYSLGVLLYELLTDQLPHDVGELTMPEALRVICHEAPLALRRHDPQLRGDLEAIVSVAMHKDPARRYSSASALAEDLRRFLSHQPVTARPATRRYFFGKFLRRHTGLVIGVTAAGVALLTGTLVSTISILKQNAALRQASQEADARGQLNDILLGLIAAPDVVSPASSLMESPRTTVEDILERLLPTLEDPSISKEVQAPLHAVASTTLRNLGATERAAEHCQRALELRREMHGDWHLSTADSLQEQALLYYDTHRLQDGLESQMRCVEIRKDLLGDEHPSTLEALHNLAILYQDLGQWEPAERLYRSVLEGHRKRQPLDEAAVALSCHNLGNLVLEQGRREEARALLEDGRRIRERVLPAEHPQLLASEYALGQLFFMDGEYEKAIPLLERVLQTLEQSLGPTHYRTIATRLVLAQNLYQVGDVEHSTLLARTVAEVSPEHLPLAHTGRVLALHTLAMSRHATNQTEEALDLLERAIPLAHKVLPRDERLIEAVEASLRSLWDQAEKPSSSFRNALELLRTGQGVTSWPLPLRWPTSMTKEGSIEPVTASLRTLAEQPFVMEEAPPEVRVWVRRAYGLCLLSLEEADLAEGELLDAQDEAMTHLGPRHPTTLALWQDLAKCRESLNDPQGAREARDALDEAFATPE